MFNKILIVDDDPANVEKLYSLLQANSYELAVANNGERAYKVALNFKPDLVLMDMMMPGWDGYETTKVFKSDPQLQHIPVIFVTAKVEEAQNAYDNGAVDYVVKPFSETEILARVGYQLSLIKNLQAMLKNQANLASTLETTQRELAGAEGKIAVLKLKVDKSNG